MNIQIYPEFHILEQTPPHDKKNFKLEIFKLFLV